MSVAQAAPSEDAVLTCTARLLPGILIAPRAIQPTGRPDLSNTIGDSAHDADSHDAAQRLRRPAVIALGVLALALSARVSATLPGSSVPQSAQTLAVLLVGSLLGSRDGTLTLLAYLLAGGAGAPIFADGASGWGHLAGPTAGYLLGFMVAALGVGLLADHRLLQRPITALGAMVGGHVLILGFGWTRLTWILGPEDALRQGVTPFLWGGCVKSLVAATVVVAIQRPRMAGGASAGRGRAARSRGPEGRL